MRSSGLMLGVGLAIGLAAGAGGMYLAVGRSRGAPTITRTAPVDAGVPAPVVGRAGHKKPRHRDPSAPASDGTADDAPGLSDADIKMVWKGDPVERPPATVDMSAGADARSLDDGEIQGAIDAGGEALRACVVSAIGTAPFSGDITVKVLVDGQGRAVKSRVHGPSFAFDRGLLGCMQKAAGKLHFPAVGGYTVVTVPFPVSTE